MTPAQVIEQWLDAAEMRVMPGTNDPRARTTAQIARAEDDAAWEREEEELYAREREQDERWDAMIATGDWERHYCFDEREDCLRWIGSEEGYAAFYLNTFGEKLFRDPR